MAPIGIAADEVPFHRCPADVELGTFVRGDTVLIVGRDGWGGWLQVRSPLDL